MKPIRILVVPVALLVLATGGDAEAGGRSLRQASRALDGALQEVVAAGGGCRGALAGDLEEALATLARDPSARQIEQVLAEVSSMMMDAPGCPFSVVGLLQTAAMHLSQAAGTAGDSESGDESDEERSSRPRPRTIDCWTRDDPGCGETRDGHNPMDRATFQAFIDTLRKEPNGLVKEEMCERAFKDHYLTVRQLISILGHFTNGLTKQDVVEHAAARVVDPKNAFMLKSAFTNAITGGEAVETVQEAAGR